MGGGAATGAGVTGTTLALTDNGRMAGAGGGNVAMGVRAGCLGGVGAGCAGGVGELMVACEESARATRHVRAKEASERASERRQETTRDDGSTATERPTTQRRRRGEEAKKRFRYPGHAAIFVRRSSYSRSLFLPVGRVRVGRVRVCVHRVSCIGPCHRAAHVAYRASGIAMR